MKIWVGNYGWFFFTLPTCCTFHKREFLTSFVQTVSQVCRAEYLTAKGKDVGGKRHRCVFFWRSLINCFYSTMMTLIALEKPNYYYHYHRKLSWRIRNSQTNTLDALILDSNFSVLWNFLSIDNHSPHNTTTESSSGTDKGCLERLTEGRNRVVFF